MAWYTVLLTFLYVSTPILTHRYGHHHKSYRASNYWCEEVQPEVTVYKPKGVRLVIDCYRGIKDIELRGKFGLKDVNASLERTYLGRHKRRWIFQDNDLWLSVGDPLNFQLIAINRRDIIHTIHNGNYLINATVEPSCVACCTICPKRNTSSSDSDSTLTPPPTSNPELDKCQEVIRNTTSNFMTLQTETMQLQKKYQLLLRAFNNSVDARKLTLQGIIPLDESPQDVVSFILWEKLDLRPKIVTAARKTPMMITFEVETINEKLEILEEAQESLNGTRISIS